MVYVTTAMRKRREKLKPSEPRQKSESRVKLLACALFEPAPSARSTCFGALRPLSGLQCLIPSSIQRGTFCLLLTEITFTNGIFAFALFALVLTLAHSRLWMLCCLTFACRILWTLCLFYPTGLCAIPENPSDYDRSLLQCLCCRDSPASRADASVVVTQPSIGILRSLSSRSPTKESRLPQAGA